MVSRVFIPWFLAFRRCLLIRYDIISNGSFLSVTSFMGDCDIFPRVSISFVIDTSCLHVSVKMLVFNLAPRISHSLKMVHRGDLIS